MNADPGVKRNGIRRMVDALPDEKLGCAEKLLGLLTEKSGYEDIEKAFERLNLLESVLDSLPDCVFAVDPEGKVMIWNRAAEEMTGVAKSEMLGRGDYAYAVPFFGKRRPLLVDIVIGRHGSAEGLGYERVERRGRILMGEGFAPSLFGGKGMYFWAFAAPVHDEKGNLLGAVQCIRDISERRRMEDELREAGARDPLTGLYNRAYFEEELKRIEKAGLFPVSLVFCDLDGLKAVNDMLGHERGDELLRRAAEIISRSVRSSDVVARLGGDEFAVILPGTDKRAAEEVAKRIGEAVEEDNKSHPDVPLSISIGVASASDNSRSLWSVYKEADDAMYINKLAIGRDPRGAILRTLKELLAEKEFHDTERLRDAACRLGEAVGLSREEMDSLRLLVEVHDIGKLAVPERILFKRGPLTESEMMEVRRHSEVGYRIALSSVELSPIAPLILQHHERWDGTGYPQGLKGEQINILSRILAIADAYDAMRSQRPYRRALSHQEALEEIRKGAGTQFDPELVEKFLNVMEYDKT